MPDILSAASMTFVSSHTVFLAFFQLSLLPKRGKMYIQFFPMVAIINGKSWWWQTFHGNGGDGGDYLR